MPIKKLLLRKIQENWKQEFPLLKPIDLDEVPRRIKGGNYVCDQYFQERNLAYFFSIDFHLKRQGEFTIDVTISNSPKQSIQTGGSRWDLDAERIGSYRLGTFVNGKDCWWALADADTLHAGNLKSLGFESADIFPTPAQNRWRPSSFDLPPGKIIAEAIGDINEKLKSFVFPKLKVEMNSTSHP